MSARSSRALAVLALCGSASLGGAGCESQAPPAAPPPAPPTPVEEAPPPQTRPWYAAGKKAAVSTGRREATNAALEVMRKGGNAADGAAAALLALSVADHPRFPFGGEVSILVYSARDGSVEAIAGQGAAPLLATRERFAQKGLPTVGAQAATVPAAPDAIVTLLERHGTTTLKEAAAPTHELLKKNDQPWHWRLAKTLRKMTDAEKKADGARSEGLLRAREEFYRGSVAREIDEWSRKGGALLRFVDLAAHTTRIEAPASLAYRGHRLVKAGAGTQGPVLLAALGTLEHFGLHGLGPHNPRAVHVGVESLKLAFADRDAYLGDPSHVDVPLEALIYPYYLSLRSKTIDLGKAAPVGRTGDPVNKKPLLEPEPRWSTGALATALGSTTCVVADQQGNVVAATASGSAGVEAGETGVWLGTRLASFNLAAEHPNALAPGKRPRSPASPTLVFKDKQPIYALSVAGDDEQEQVTLQLLTDLIDFQMLPEEAIVAPRWATRPREGVGHSAAQAHVLRANPALIEAAGPALETMGHRLEAHEAPIGAPSLVVIDPRFKILVATGDPAAGQEAGAL